MNIGNAIRLAIEKGGYSLNGKQCSTYPDIYDHIVLDPLFWQALGKALGWNNQYVIKKFAHQYFDLVLTGGDTEKFWQSLLNH